MTDVHHLNMYIDNYILRLPRPIDTMITYRVLLYFNLVSYGTQCLVSVAKRAEV